VLAMIILGKKPEEASSEELAEFQIGDVTSS